MKGKPFILSVVFFVVMMSGFLFWKMQEAKPVIQDTAPASVINQDASIQEKKVKQIIYGTVYKENQDPFASVILTWSTKDQSGTIKSGENGYYEFALPENIKGQLEFALSQYGYRKWSSDLHMKELSFPVKQDIQLSNDGLLFGRIIDKDTQKYISDCRLQISASRERFGRRNFMQGRRERKSYEFTSDQDGYFCFDLKEKNITSAQCLLLAQSSGYKSTLKEIALPRLESSGMDIPLPSIANQTIELEPGNDRKLKGNTIQKNDKSFIPGVNVHFEISNSYIELTTVSDEAGTFDFSLPDTNYIVYGEKPGYHSEHHERIQFLKEEDTSEPVDIQLSRTYEISGYVLEKDSNIPVPGVKISTRTRFGMQETVSETNGYYCFTDFCSNFFIPTLQSPDYLPANAAINPLPLSDEYLITDYNLYVIRAIVLKGTVENTLGDPIARARIREANRNRRQRAESFLSNEDGSFRLLVRPNQYYQFQFSAYGYQNALSPGIIVKESPLEDLKMVMSSTLSISGKVEDISGTPVALANIKYRYSSSGRGRRGRREETAFSAKDGRFTITNIQPGELEISAMHPTTGQYSEKQSIEIQEESITDVVLQIEEVKSITGYIQDTEGNIIEEALVRIRYSRTKTYEAYSDHQGYFELANIPFGSHTLTVSHENYLNKQLRNIDAGSSNDIILEEADLIELELYIMDKNTQEPVSQFYVRGRDKNRTGIYEQINDRFGHYKSDKKLKLPVELSIYSDGYQADNRTISTSESAITIELVPSIKVTGQIIDEESSDPIAYARVRLQNTGYRARASVTDAYGYFSLENSPSGEMKLNVSHADYATTVQDVTISQTDEYDLGKITLSKDGIILIGTVVNSEKKPLPNTPLELLRNNRKVDSVLADSNGKFEFSKLRQGQYTIKSPAKKEFSKSVKIKATDKKVNIQVNLDKKQKENTKKQANKKNRKEKTKNANR